MDHDSNSSGHTKSKDLTLNAILIHGKVLSEQPGERRGSG
jgi:hypothetical protein